MLHPATKPTMTIKIKFNPENEITGIESELGLSTRELIQIAHGVSNDPLWLQSPADRKTDASTTISVEHEDIIVEPKNTSDGGVVLSEQEASEITEILEEILELVGTCHNLGDYIYQTKTELETTREAQQTFECLRMVRSLAQEGNYRYKVEDLAQLAEEHVDWILNETPHSVSPEAIPERLYPEGFTVDSEWTS